MGISWYTVAFELAGMRAGHGDLAAATAMAPMLPMLEPCLRSFGLYLCYIVPVACLLLAVRHFLSLPRELFRKLLHVAAFISTPVIMRLSGDWLVAVAVLVAFGLVVWPALALLERFPWYAELFVERRAHEVRRSLLLLFLGNAAVVAVCWGVFGNPPVAETSILMWGLGDAAAALVGKRWGRHLTGLPLADPAKTWEGTLANLVVAWAVGVASLVLLGGSPLPAAMWRALLGAAVGAYVELVTKGGYDTLTVPAAIAAVLLVLG